MSDYIDRAALGIGLCNRDIFENKGYADGWNAAVKILKEAPVADVQEIKHGEWMKDDSDGCYCSVCKWYADYDYDYVTNNGLGNDDFDYCSHCGAIMDGGNNNA
ncbi:MAG: hypothetical protein UE499_08680 [Acutalibacteraceae bacterium]|jgi:hypothetical protein|nr:hypothetical protein [Acutalibacteraceae bacterium]